jgi:TRAP-type C4-dicarboxylate transport system permease small subunit
VHAVNRFNYMAIINAVMVLFSLLSLVNAGFLYSKITRFGRAELHRYDVHVLILMAATLLVGGCVALFFYYQTEKLSK